MSSSPWRRNPWEEGPDGAARLPRVDDLPAVDGGYARDAVDSAFASGALSPRRDTELIERLHQWRSTVSAVNHRLDLTESLTFATNSPEEVEQFNRALHREGGYLHGVQELLKGLSEGPFAGRRRGE